MHKLQEALLHLVEREDISDLSLRQIGERIDEPHPQKVAHHLNQLKKKGLINYDKNGGVLERRKMGRQKNSFVISIPIVGAANCGPATLYADENIEGCLQVSNKLLKKKQNIFAIRAEGKSMNMANIDGKSIEPGDYVIVDGKNKNPKNGDYVLSVINDVANIKKFVHQPEENQIVLVSESTQQFPPLYIHEDDMENFLINGIVVQVIKKP